MMNIDGAAVRELVASMPGYVFDQLVWEMPELLENLQAWQVRDYVHWHECGSPQERDEVAQWYDYEDMEDMLETGPYVMLCDDGVLVIE